MFGGDVLSELADRWQRARRAAAERVMGRTVPEADEDARLRCAAEVDEPEFHRLLFENGVRLGAGFRRAVGRAVNADELPQVLASLRVPCLAALACTPLERERGFLLTRPPCAQAPLAARCDAWREAIDGLVAGLNDELHHTRTASAGRGQPTCVDVLYGEPEGEARYGALPDALTPALESVQRFVRQVRGADVRFLGVSEGVLLYQLEAAGCDDATQPRALVSSLLRQKLPHLQPRELSPRNVLEAPAPGDDPHE